MFLGLAIALASCSKAESKKTDPDPETAPKAPEPAPPEPAAELKPEPEPPIKLEPVQAQVKGVANPDPKAKDPEPTQEGEAKPEPKPEPAPAGESDSSFKLVVEQPGEVAAGAATTLRIRVTPGTGYKMNAEFPTKLTLDPTAGVKLDKTSLVLADAEKFDEQQLVFAVKATPEAAGSYTVNGKIKFAVCTDATCDPKKRNVAFTVTAK